MYSDIWPLIGIGSPVTSTGVPIRNNLASERTSRSQSSPEELQCTQWGLCLCGSVGLVGHPCTGALVAWHLVKFGKVLAAPT